MKSQSRINLVSTMSLFAFFVTAFVGISAQADVTKGQLDDFEDGTTQGWQEALGGLPSPNPPTNVATGGPDGAGDNYLQNISAGIGKGAKQTQFNIQPQWTGDYIAVGVKKICAHAKVEATSDQALSMRAGFQTAESKRFVSLTPVVVPKDGNWYEVTLPISSSSLVPVGFPTPIYNQVMSNVNHFRIFHSETAAFQGAELAATAGLDNIRAWGSTGDINGDCRADILLRNSSTGVIWQFQMDGASIDNSVGIKQTSTRWFVVGNGDYNGDGFADILLCHKDTGVMWMYLMNSTGIAVSAGVTTIGLPWHVVGHGDYDGDGKSDILLRNESTGVNWMFLMNGTMISSSQGVNTISTAWDVVGSGDYNGDGNSDILLHNSSTGVIWMYLMTGASIDDSQPINIIGQFSSVVGNGDFDGDGKSDILLRNGSTGVNWMYLMDGTMIASNLGINTVSTNWQVAGSRDHNGDGNADIVWHNNSTGVIWMYLMSGATIDDSTGVTQVGTGWSVIDAD